MNKARIIVMLFALTIITCPVFAATPVSLGDDYVTVNKTAVRNPFSLPLSLFESIIISGATGGLVASKFVIDIVRAYLSGDHETEALKKAVTKFLVTVMVVSFFMLVLMYVTGISSTS